MHLFAMVSLIVEYGGFRANGFPFVEVAHHAEDLDCVVFPSRSRTSDLEQVVSARRQPPTSNEEVGAESFVIDSMPSPDSRCRR